VTEEVNDIGGRYPTVTYTAMPGERNIVTMTRVGGPHLGVTIRDDGADIVAGAGCTAVDSHSVQCSQTPYLLNGVELQASPAVAIDAGDGDDSVKAVISYSDYDVSLFGGAGADLLTGGGLLRGGPGDDVLVSTSPEPDLVCDKACSNPPPTVLAGGLGNDVLRGGVGSDVLIGDGESESSADPGGGNDVLDGGPGADIAVYGGRDAPVRVDLTGALPSGSAGENDRLAGIESVRGGRGPDVLLGGDQGDQLDGGAGDDTLDGRGGDDDLIDGPGSDTLLGGAGNDQLSGGQVGDRLYGGPGNDTMFPPLGSSLRVAGVVHCGSGRDLVPMPQSQPLVGCEQVRLDYLLVLTPRRLRDGRLRSVLECLGGSRCEVVIKVRRGSTVLARRSVTIPFRSRRTVDLRPRAHVRAGQMIDVTIAGRNVARAGTSGRPPSGSSPIRGRWQMPL
jgi:Ca2+-binding RTX toxin-like protein